MGVDARLNRFERAAKRQALLDQKLAGQGIYVFKNHTGAELMLPKATLSGKTRLSKDEEFQGDNYFMSLVKNNMLILVREISSPEQQKKAKLMEEQKLLLDQPDKVTHKGKVEQVVANSKSQKKLHENKKSNTEPEVLLNESPADLSGVEIIQN